MEKVLGSFWNFIEKILHFIFVKILHIKMEKETIGTIISVTKQWWLKVNRKSVRIHAMDGADFPYIIKIKYTIEGKDYICRKCIGAGKKIPDKGATIKVIYCEDRPSKVKIKF